MGDGEKEMEINKKGAGVTIPARWCN